MRYWLLALAVCLAQDDDRLLWSWSAPPAEADKDEWVEILATDAAVYVTQLRMDKKARLEELKLETVGKLRALDAVTGKETWCVDSTARVSASDAKRLYGVAGTSLVALDPATGREIWRTELKVPEKYEFDVVSVAGERLYVRAGTGEMVGFATFKTEGTLFCVNREKGELAWKAEVGCAHGPDRILERDGRTYGMSYDGRVFCLEAETGREVWTKKLGATFVNPDLSADGKRLVLRSHSGKVQAVDVKDGGAIWTNADDVTRVMPVQEGTGVVAAGSSLLYRHGMGGVRCLSMEDGKVRWSVELKAGLTQPGEEPIAEKDRVYVGYTDGARARVECRDLETGKPVWEWKQACKNPLGRAGQLALAGGRLFYVAAGRTIFCVKAK